MDTFDSVGRRIVGTKTLEQHQRDEDEIPTVMFVQSEGFKWSDD